MRQSRVTARSPDVMGEWLPTVEEAVDSFLAAQELAGRPAQSVRVHASALKPLRAPDPVSTLTASTCEAILLPAVRRNPGTARTLHSYLSTFAAYCVSRHWLEVNPMAHVPRPRKPPARNRWLSADELHRVWQAARDDYTRLILSLLILGLRANELCSARWIDVSGDTLRVMFSKGGKPRTVNLNPATLALLAACRNDNARIVPITTNALRLRLKTLGKHARVPHLHPHLFRHTFATQYLLAAGVEDIATLRTQGGWASDQMIRSVYAATVMEEVALKRAREVDLQSRLFGD